MAVARGPRRPKRRNALTTFRDLGVLHPIADALERVGITKPFPIQEMTLPVALMGSDLIGQARTGTGKTFAFGVPLLQRIVAPTDREYDQAADPGKPQALVVGPTRELAVQVTADLRTASTVRGVRMLTVYGGRAYEPQIEALRTGVDVVVGTPGRLLDLVGQRHLDLGHLNVRAESPDETQTVPATAQFVYRAHSLDKDEIIARLLQAEGRGLTMIFCKTKRQTQRIADELASRWFAVAAVHGDLGQAAREQALRAFRNGKVDVLVATDVAARGIDVEGVTHVVNVACPEDEKTYLHRIGRTGRAGASGVAVTLVDWDDVPLWKMINRILDLPFDEPVETYSASEHLFHDLGIPPGTTGRLPEAAQTRAGLAAEDVEDLGETGRGRPGRPGRGRSGGRERGGTRSTGERRPRRERSRRRTRGGEPVGEARSPAPPETS